MENAKELSTQDLRNLLALSESLKPGESAFRQHALESLMSLFGFREAIFHQVDENGLFSQPTYINMRKDVVERYFAHYHTSDYFAPANHTSKKRVLTVRDFMSFPEWEQSALYQSCHQALNLYDQATVMLKNDGAPIGVVIVYHDKKHPGFSRRELAILEQVGQLLEKQYATHMEMERARQEALLLKNILDGASQGIAVCDQGFRLQMLNRPAVQLLEEHFGLSQDRSEIERFLRERLVPVYERNHACAFSLPDTFEVSFQVESFLVRDGDSMSTHYAVFVSNRERSSHWQSYVQKQGLTARERQIAMLILEGKDNASIASELIISVHTVKRHAESIYRKLGVTGRYDMIALHHRLAQ